MIIAVSLQFAGWFLTSEFITIDLLTVDHQDQSGISPMFEPRAHAAQHFAPSGWKHVFFHGPEHHELHLRLAFATFGGCRICTGQHGRAVQYEQIRHLDGNKVVWFFADVHPDILPHLRGKSIYIPHGLGPKPFVYKIQKRIEMFREHFSQAWLTGALQAPEYYWSDIPRDKLFEIGYTPLFYLPKLPERHRSVFISCGWFEELMPFSKMIPFLRHFPETLDVYVSCHPSTPAENQEQYRQVCRQKGFTFVDTEDEMLRLYSYCQRAIVGLSSSAIPFFYQNKPVIFLKERNRFPLFQWYRLRTWIKLPLFHEVVSQSTRFLDSDKITEEMVLKAQPAPSAHKLFFPNNWDKDKTRQRMINAYRQLFV